MPFTKSQPPIYYEVHGSGPSIVFSHGMMMNGSMFSEQVSHFSKNYRCITWDERAHGKTADAAGDKIEPFTYYDSASDVIAILDDLNIKSAIIAGMSQGGYLAQRAAYTYPDRVTGLILLNTQAEPEDVTNAAGYKKIIDDCIPSGQISQEVKDQFTWVIFHPEYPKIKEWVDYWGTRDPRHLSNAVSTLQNRDDFSDKAKELKQPALVIHSDDDKAITLERARKMHNALPNSTLFVVDNENHSPNMSSPATVNAEIERWLKTNFQ